MYNDERQTKSLKNEGELNMAQPIANQEHILVRLGKERFAQQSAPSLIQFTGNQAFDVLLNDLENTPHAFVLACLMDKQIKAERAWSIPCILMNELGRHFPRVLRLRATCQQFD